MQEVTFTLRTLTPLFLAGADQTSAEILGSNFPWSHAVLVSRSDWWRSWSRQRRLTTGYESRKSAIFGATDTGSNISIRISEASKDPQRFRKESYSRENVSGRDYSFWSMAASGKGDRYKPDCLLFPKDTIFRVTLSSKGDDDTKLQQAIAAFWLLTHLGGIGSRSRRCAGSVTVDDIDGDDNKTGLDFATPENREDLEHQISEGIKITQKLARESLPANTLTLVTQTTFDSLSQETCSIWILHNDNWHTPDTAMQAIGNNLQTYRRDLPLQSRTVFGLPLMDVDNRSRQASPLLLRIVELQKGRYAGLAVLFKTGHNWDYTLIEKWANGFPGRTKVTL